MSALRKETLRLLWLEVFLAVYQERNLSGAARALGIHQSTVTRCLQELQAWLGKTLVEFDRIGKARNLIVSIKITDAGEAFSEIARRTVAELNGFRAANQDKLLIISRMKNLVTSMKQDIKDGNFSLDSDIISLYIQSFSVIIAKFTIDTSILPIKKSEKELINFYNKFEKTKNYEKRRQKLSPVSPVPEMPQGWFEDFEKSKSGEN